MSPEYKPAQFREQNFHCPSCGVLAFQNWSRTYSSLYNGNEFSGLQTAQCQNCDELSIWYDSKMVYPKVLTALLAHEDMPETVKVIYNEARNVASDSSRAAAALLRVALEKLTEELGETEGTLNARIGKLSKKGLPQKAIQSLDIVRIFANEGGSHAGEIDLSGADSDDIVNRLFKLTNFIVEKTITENKEIEEIYGTLPPDKINGITNRDRS